MINKTLTCVSCGKEYAYDDENDPELFKWNCYRIFNICYDFCSDKHCRHVFDIIIDNDNKNLDIK